MLGLVALEFAGAIILFALLVLDVFAQPAAFVPTAIALAVAEGLVTLALGVVLLGAWRGRARARSLGIVLQVLFAATGIWMLQGAVSFATLGWPLVIAGTIGVGLLLSPPVAGWLSRRGEAA